MDKVGQGSLCANGGCGTLLHFKAISKWQRSNQLSQNGKSQGRDLSRMVVQV